MTMYPARNVSFYCAGVVLVLLTSPAGALAVVPPNPASSLTASAVPQQLATRALCLLRENNEEQQPQIVTAELAITAEQRATGLMMRENLAQNSGMLFVYPNTGQRSFWMFRTLIPLDIAFVSAEGEILDIQQMQPCRSYWNQRCPSYPAAEPFLYALEVNLGKFSEWGVSVGDWVLQDDCESNLEGLEAW